jgi:NADH-quinone oxidoreductase subunit D
MVSYDDVPRSDSSSDFDMLLNMGPQHPSTHGVFRMLLKIDGEVVTHAEPHIGYLHRGSERLTEVEQYHQVVTLMDRLDYLSNFNNEWVYCRAVEKLIGVNIPERAEYIRVILGELNRIASHLLFIGTFGLDIGAMTPVMFAFRGRERIQSLFESVSGARMMHNYFHIGGLKEDLPENFSDNISRLIPILREDIEETDRLLSFNELFVSRTKGVGVISKELAIDYGWTGPCLRACGVGYDVRRTEPYSVYDRFDFKIPTTLDGDCWDRYFVRVMEIYESLSIVEQALEQMPDGSVNVMGRRLVRPAKNDVYMKAENPRGEIGIYLISDGSDKPYRLKVRPPSFCNLSALKELITDTYIADAVVILGSLDIVLGEVDR